MAVMASATVLASIWKLKRRSLATSKRWPQLAALCVDGSSRCLRGAGAESAKGFDPDAPWRAGDAVSSPASPGLRYTCEHSLVQPRGLPFRAGFQAHGGRACAAQLVLEHFQHYVRRQEVTFATKRVVMVARRCAMHTVSMTPV